MTQNLEKVYKSIDSPRNDPLHFRKKFNEKNQHRDSLPTLELPLAVDGDDVLLARQQPGEQRVYDVRPLDDVTPMLITEDAQHNTDDTRDRRHETQQTDDCDHDDGLGRERLVHQERGRAGH